MTRSRIDKTGDVPICGWIYKFVSLQTPAIVLMLTDLRATLDEIGNDRSK